MLVRIYGFALNRKELPPDIPTSEILEYLQSNSNLISQDTLRWIIATAKIANPNSQTTTNWFLGVLLKVRDASRFTKVALRDGKLNITSEVLRENEKLLEANCFLLNPTKATGIYSHYRGAGSLQYDFQKVFQRTLRILQKKLRNKYEEDNTEGISQKEKRKRLEGRVVVDALLLRGDPKEVISKFKRIKNASLKLIGEDTKFSLFSGMQSKVISRKLQVSFSDDAEPSQIAEVIHGAIHAPDQEISEASVQGIDEHDFHRTMSFDTNPMILGEFDYSNVMKDFNLQEDTAADNILCLEISQQLIRLASTDQIWRLLNPEEK
jgi:hypothetical protein